MADVDLDAASPGPGSGIKSNSWCARSGSKGEGESKASRRLGDKEEELDVQCCTARQLVH